MATRPHTGWHARRGLTPRERPVWVWDGQMVRQVMWKTSAGCWHDQFGITVRFNLISDATTSRPPPRPGKDALTKGDRETMPTHQTIPIATMAAVLFEADLRGQHDDRDAAERLLAALERRGFEVARVERKP